jgi:serine/threonine-protein kinase
MSPEQCAQSGPLDARSDIYSFGIIVYEMLAGRVPFTGESPTVIMMKQVQDPPPSVLEARPDLPAAVARVVMRGLAKQPSDRFQSAGEFSAALADGAASASTAPVTAAPETTANAPVGVIDDDETTLVQPRPVDEITVVQPRRVEPTYQQPVTPYQQPLMEEAPLPNVNPWRIMIPAAIVLIAVFGVVFLLTRGNGQTSVTSVNANVNANQSVLMPDPNSQPVQPMGTPTGVSESNVQPQPSTMPTPRPANVNTEPASVVGDFGANENSNAPRNRNANVRSTPTPRSTPSSDEPPPPPRPTPTLSEVVKPVKPKASPTP